MDQIIRITLTKTLLTINRMLTNQSNQLKTVNLTRSNPWKKELEIKVCAFKKLTNKTRKKTRNFSRTIQKKTFLRRTIQKRSWRTILTITGLTWSKKCFIKINRKSKPVTDLRTRDRVTQLRKGCQTQCKKSWRRRKSSWTKQ